MKKKGFTLIELLVVCAIIATLATIILVAGGKSRMKARDTRRISDMSQIQVALEAYYDQSSTTARQYPPALSDLVAYKFLPYVPKDPNGNTYQYNKLSNISYCLGIDLEASSTVLRNSSSTCVVTGLSGIYQYKIAP